jgi:hypothetical protein
VAAGTTELAHPDVARANGVPWQTGVVTEDNMTLVLGTDSMGHFPDPVMLTVATGQNAPWAPLGPLGVVQVPHAAIAAYDASGYVSPGGQTGHQALYATSQYGVGLYGASSTSNGVSGHSDNGTGVYGNGHDHGVVGNSDAGAGGAFSGGRVPLYLQSAGSPGAPLPSGHVAGDIYVDSIGHLFVFTIGGVWLRLPGVPNGTAGGAISYLSTPIRLLDARNGASSGFVNRGPLAGNEVYTFVVDGLGGIPAGAQGLIGNCTVLGPSDVGNLSLFPAGGSVPTVASMTFGTAGLFLANGVNVAIGAGGAINIQNQSNGTTPLVLDAVAFVA